MKPKVHPVELVKPLLDWLLLPSEPVLTADCLSVPSPSCSANPPGELLSQVPLCTRNILPLGVQT